jgi:hypothetical protein
MKNNTLYSFCCSFLLIFSYSFPSFGQIDNAATPICLRIPPSDGIPQTSIMDAENAWQWRKSLMMGQRDSSANRSIQKFRELFDETHQNGVLVYPVGQVYNHVVFQDNQWLVKSDTSFFCNLSQSHLVDRQMKFIFPQNGSWWQGNWALLEIDFDDGLGWRNFNNGVFDVYYGDVFSDKQLQFKARFDDHTYYFTALLKSAQCQSVFPAPHLPSWISDNADAPWQVQADTEWGVVTANAYTLNSEDGIFDRPFIFIEGIDFGNEHYENQNGTFGWCQFTGGDYSGDYSMMSESPVFLSELRARGYDIVLLDFFDGAADIRANAEVLIKLIHLCKSHKQGNETMVIAGASMGGQVARCALGKMEMQGEKHCVGVYVSLDSPHEGANIPLGLQALLSFMSNYNANAEAFVSSALTRPAAQQLLIYQWFDSEGQVAQPWKRAEYQAYLESIPFPTQCFSIGIANGNLQGESLNCDPFLIEENCDASFFIPGNELELRAFTLPGDLTNVNNTSTSNVIADLTYTTVNWNGIIPDITQDHQLLYVPNDLPAMDCWPGGHRASMGQLVSALNASSDFVDQCGTITSSQYLALHCFVPSASALAVPLTLNSSMSAMEQSPFDLVYAPYAMNEPHSALTLSNATWLLYHLDNTLANQQLLLSSSNSYNFGTAEDLIFPNWDIQQNQVVSIQKQQGLHLGDLPFPAVGSHHEMKTQVGCEGADIHLHGKARLEIGDEQGLSTASLVVRGGTTLRIYEKGVCWIYPGSSLVIENGGRVILSGEGGLRNLGGQIVLKEGGELIYQMGYCSLESEDATVQLKGGLVHLLPNAHLNWTPVDGQTGRIEVFQNQFSEFYLETGAEMRLNGNDEQDVILAIEPGAFCDQVSYFDAHVIFAQGILLLGKNASMKWRADFTGKKLKIEAIQVNNEEANLITEKNHIDLYQAAMKNIKWSSNAISTKLFNVQSSGSRNWDVSQGDWYFKDGQVLGHGIEFSEMSASAVFGNVTMTGEGNAFGIRHQGPSSLVMNDCQISDYYTGIHKFQGKVGLGCTALSQLIMGAVLSDQALLMINGGYGRNQWLNNDVHLLFQQAAPPMIEDGGNLFSGSLTGPYATGEIIYNEESGVLNWSGNEWLTTGPTDNFNIQDQNAEPFIVTMQPEVSYQDCSTTELYDFKSMNNQETTASLFPNPSESGQAVRLTGGPPQKVIDASGRDVLNQINVFSSLEYCELQANHLSAGVYWVIQNNQVIQWLLLP